MHADSPFSISIIIIGYNTKKTLIKLLSSINNQILSKKHSVEIIYVDDGSVDGSFKAFQKFNLKFHKKNIKLVKNLGRVAATQAGIDIAEGTWCYFVRSNIRLDKNALRKFIYSISTQNAVAFMGSIKYESSDFVFQNYLNHSKRGINAYNNHDLIHYKCLLFGNCMVRSDVLCRFSLNKNLLHYGGEELDFSEKIFLNYNKQIQACRGARAVRVGHPDFAAHCKRLEAFGKYNINCLSIKNQVLVLGVGFYLKKFKSLSWVWKTLMFFSLKFYRYNFLYQNYFLIRLGFLSSIMTGVIKSRRLVQNSQTPSLLVLLLPILLF